MGILEEFGFEGHDYVDSYDFKGYDVSVSNSLKSLNGNALNRRVHEALEDLRLEGILGCNYKEKGFSGLAGYIEEKVILDSYIESVNEYHFFDGVRPLRIGIDNTTVLRKDRFRGKQYEAFMLKEDRLIDYFIVITLDEVDILGTYTNDDYEVLGIKRLQEKILEKRVNTVVDNVLTCTKAISFIKEMCMFKETKNRIIQDYIKELELKYKF